MSGRQINADGKRLISQLGEAVVSNPAEICCCSCPTSIVLTFYDYTHPVYGLLDSSHLIPLYDMYPICSGVNECGRFSTGISINGYWFQVTIFLSKKRLHRMNVGPNFGSGNGVFDWPNYGGSSTWQQCSVEGTPLDEAIPNANPALGGYATIGTT